jgi:hypothetical protein
MPAHVYSYQVLQASVIPLSQIKRQHPDLITHIDPTDLTRLRCVITLQNNNGDLCRLRLLQWNDLGLEEWMRIGPEKIKALAEGVGESLKYLELGDVKGKLGLKR